MQFIYSVGIVRVGCIAGSCRCVVLMLEFVVVIEDVSASTALEHLEKESEDRGSFDVRALQFSQVLSLLS